MLLFLLTCLLSVFNPISAGAGFAVPSIVMSFSRFGFGVHTGARIAQRYSDGLRDG
jgi:hypothetical protein